MTWFEGERGNFAAWGNLGAPMKFASDECQRLILDVKHVLDISEDHQFSFVYFSSVNCTQ
jgi:hypothetical protein